MNSRSQKRWREEDSRALWRACVEGPPALRTSQINQRGAARDWASTPKRLNPCNPSNQWSVPIHCPCGPARFRSVRQLFGASARKSPFSPQISPTPKLQVGVRRMRHHNPLDTERTYLGFCTKTCLFAPKKSGRTRSNLRLAERRARFQMHVDRASVGAIIPASGSFGWDADNSHFQAGPIGVTSGSSFHAHRL